MFRFRYLIIAAVAIILGTPSGAAAMGISPNVIDLPNIHGDFPAARSFLISRADALMQVSVSAEWIGTGAKFIEAETIAPFILVSGQKSFNYKFKIGKVGAKSGEYEATLKIKILRDNGNDVAMGMGVAEGVVGTVHFSITDEYIVSDQISNASLRVDASNKAIVSYTISNQGNRPVSYGKVALVNLKDNSIIFERSILDNIAGQFSQREFHEEFKLIAKPKSGDVFRADIFDSKGGFVLSSNNLTPVALGGGKIAIWRVRAYRVVIAVAVALLAMLICFGSVLRLSNKKTVGAKAKKEAKGKNKLHRRR